MEKLENNNRGRGENMRETIGAQPKRKRPGGAVAEYSLWESRIDQSTGEEVGVRNPEGEYTDLQQGEHFAIERDIESGTFKAVVKDSAGTILRILGEGSLPIKEHEEALKEAEASEIYNIREQLGTYEGVEKELEKIATSVEELPPLKEGYVRLIHITDPKTADTITRDGLHYEMQGMVNATARAYSNAVEAMYYSDDPRFSFEGAKAVVLDMPMDEYRTHNDIKRSPGVVPSKYVVGIIDAVR